MSINIPQPPNSTHPISDSNGIVTNEYIRWFQTLVSVLTEATDSIQAPSDATYVLNTANSVLGSAQVLGNLPTGFAKVLGGSGALISQASILPTDLANSGVSSGTYGNSLNIPQITVNNAGLITNIVTTALNSSLGFNSNFYTQCGGF